MRFKVWPGWTLVNLMCRGSKWHEAVFGVARCFQHRLSCFKSMGRLVLPFIFLVVISYLRFLLKIRLFGELHNYLDFFIVLVNNRLSLMVILLICFWVNKNMSFFSYNLFFLNLMAIAGLFSCWRRILCWWDFCLTFIFWWTTQTSGWWQDAMLSSPWSNLIKYQLLTLFKISNRILCSLLKRSAGKILVHLELIVLPSIGNPCQGFVHLFVFEKNVIRRSLEQYIRVM